MTHCSDAVILVNLISTHTLTWSVTNTNVIPDKNKKFQLTRSRGAWREDFNRWCLRCMISTHTLTWSVTSIQIVVINDDTISTHTLTWSVTIFQMYLICCIKFQLTRSRGAWLPEKSTCIAEFSFQLTRSRGAWRSSKSRFLLPCLFQLTRSRGAWHGIKIVA